RWHCWHRSCMILATSRVYVVSAAATDAKARNAMSACRILLPDPLVKWKWQVFERHPRQRRDAVGTMALQGQAPRASGFAGPNRAGAEHEQAGETHHCPILLV